MLKNHVIYTTFCDWKFGIAKAEGSFIWTTEGKKLVDFTSGWNVANLGWNHPEVTEAIVEQLSKKSYASMWMSDEAQDRYAAELVEALPTELTQVGRATGGTEAIEEALKTARAHTGRKKILGFRGTYHGQSFGAMAVGTSAEDSSDVAPLVPEFMQTEFPETFRIEQSPAERLATFRQALEEKLGRSDVAAVVTEAGVVTGEGSMAIAPPGYLPAVREVTKKFGTLLILDEIGTGFSRCGTLFGLEQENIVPDIVTLAKGQSNGAAPIGTMVTTEEIAENTLAKSSIGSTFGWLPVASAAAHKVLEIHRRDKVWQQAAETGAYFLQALKAQLNDHPLVGDVRGVGMEIGVDLVVSKDDTTSNAKVGRHVRQAALENGLHLAPGVTGLIQLMPPLTIDRPTLDSGIEILVKTINDWH